MCLHHSVLDDFKLLISVIIIVALFHYSLLVVRLSCHVINVVHTRIIFR